MIVTCDTQVSMGYYYLMKPRHKRVLNRKSTIRKKLDVVKGQYFTKKLAGMKLEKENYNAAIDSEFHERYPKDKTSNGHISGIELQLPEKQLLKLLDHGAFEIHEIEYEKQKFHFIPFAAKASIFKSNCRLYTITDHRDSFAIIALDKEIIPGNACKQAEVQAFFTRDWENYDLDYLRDLRVQI